MRARRGCLVVGALCLVGCGSDEGRANGGRGAPSGAAGTSGLDASSAAGRAAPGSAAIGGGGAARHAGGTGASEPEAAGAGGEVAATAAGGMPEAGGAAAAATGGRAASSETGGSATAGAGEPGAADAAGSAGGPARSIPPGVSVTEVAITNDVAQASVKRLGLNTGGFSEDSMKNLIENPGFEAGVFGTVFRAASGATADTFRALDWSGQPAGFWDGAEYEIVYGPSQGRAGTVTAFDTNGSYVFTLDTSASAGTLPEQGDIMLVRRSVPGYRGAVARASSDVRPGSPGTQSCLLGEDYSYYWDAYYRDVDESTNKLFLVAGTWRFRGWVKGDPGAQVRVRFFRERDDTLGRPEQDFIDVTHDCSGDWEQIDAVVDVPDGADPNTDYPPGHSTEGSLIWAVRPILGLNLHEVTGTGSIRVDDIELFREDLASNPTAFSDRFVARLKEYRPGVLRYWGGQLGDTLDNQLAEPFARRTVGYRPDSDEPTSFNYSLHEFLELCEEVGAEPWYVISPTMSPAELVGLVEYLAAPEGSGSAYAERRTELGHPEPWTQAFPRIHLEWGNELWGGGDPGDPFGGASVSGGVRLGAIASDRFAILRQSPYFDADALDLIIGGQAGYAGRQREIEANATEHDTVALAPYFGVLDTWSSDAEMYEPLFANPEAQVSGGAMGQSRGYLTDGGQGTGLAIYEINFHTTGGEAPEDVRNEFVAGQAGAVALPLHMLTYQTRLGAVDQCAFSILQYSFRYQHGTGFHDHRHVRLWGMLRDLNSTERKRPTWLGVETVNRAIMGDAVVTQQTGDNPDWTQAPINGIGEATLVHRVQSFAYREGGDVGLVLFNLDLAQRHGVRLSLPAAPRAVADGWWIVAEDIAASNEDARGVSVGHRTLSDFTNGYELVLEPHSLTVLRWEE